MASDLIATRNSHSHLHSCRSQEHSKWRRNIKSKHAWFATQDFWPEPAAVFVGAFQGSLSISRHPVTPGGPTERGVPKNYANCRFHLMTWWMLQCYSYIISNIHITYCHILYAILVCVLKLRPLDLDPLCHRPSASPSVRGHLVALKCDLSLSFIDSFDLTIQPSNFWISSRQNGKTRSFT